MGFPPVGVVMVESTTAYFEGKPCMFCVPKSCVPKQARNASLVPVIGLGCQAPLEVKIWKAKGNKV